MDDVDIAKRNNEQFERLVLKRQLATMPQGESAKECDDCGEEIPEARRKAAIGCIRCVFCQQKFEKAT